MDPFFEKFKNETLKNYWPVIVGIFLLLLYFLPYIIYGENVPILILDNLDGLLPSFKVLAENFSLLNNGSGQIHQIMNGIPFFAYPSEFSLLVVLFIFLTPFTAYVLNLIFIHVIGVVGMAFLLKNHIFKEEKDKIFIITISLGFGFLPFWPFGALSVAGLPLALNSFLNIRKSTDNKIDWVILVLLPFYSSFYYSFLFFIFFIVILLIVDFFFTKQFNKKFLYSIVMMTLTFLFVENKLLFSSFFNNSYVSDRIEFLPNNYSFLDSYRSFANNFRFGQVDAYSYQQFIILQFCLLVLAIILISTVIKSYPQIKNTNIYLKINSILEQHNHLLIISFLVLLLFLYFYRVPQILFVLITPFIIVSILVIFYLKLALIKKSGKLIDNYDLLQNDREFQFIIIVSILLFLSFVYGFWENSIFFGLKNSISYLRMFQIRFYWLEPLFWFIAFALGILIIKTIFKNKVVVPFLILLVIIQISVPFQINYFVTVNNNNTQYVNSQDNTFFIPFNSFYSADLFSQIKHDINMSVDSYRVASLGIEPGVSIYNGFYTLDGYMVNYPVEYKHEFRIIIQKELEKNSTLKNYFDNWGSRCYLFSSELGLNFDISKSSNLSVSNLELNMTQFKLMGGKFIFSAVPILDTTQLNLKLFGTYETPTSYWKVYVYQVL